MWMLVEETVTGRAGDCAASVDVRRSRTKPRRSGMAGCAPFYARQFTNQGSVCRIGTAHRCPNEPMMLAIVEDDDDVRLALSRLLRAMGHQVKLFTSAVG